MWNALNDADKFKALVDIGGVVLTAIGLLFAGYQFRSGVQQYKAEQRWKRKEYAAREYDRLVNEPKTGLALLMLDWDARHLPILTDRDGKPIQVAVGRRMLGRALIPHGIRHRPSWGDEEAAIRDHFDAMLERLSSFEIMMTEGLVEEGDLGPYLAYWMALIGDPTQRSSPDVIHILWLYIKAYKFNLVPLLARRFGYTLDVPDDFAGLLEEQCREGIWSGGHSSPGIVRAPVTPPPPDEDHSGMADG